MPRKQVKLSVSEKIHDLFSKAAEEEGLALSTYIRMLALEHLGLDRDGDPLPAPANSLKNHSDQPQNHLSLNQGNPLISESVISDSAAAAEPGQKQTGLHQSQTGLVQPQTELHKVHTDGKKGATVTTSSGNQINITVNVE